VAGEDQQVNLPKESLTFYVRVFVTELNLEDELLRQYHNIQPVSGDISFR
jgi:hypothetical protein